MRLITATALLLGCSTAALAECPVGDIEKLLSTSLDGVRMTEKPVTDIQSTEGGAWRIYGEAGGKFRAIVRIDAGESGMNEMRLVAVNARAYGISSTRVDYLRHAFIDEAGPNGTARRTTQYFYYCDGKLYEPPTTYSTLDGSYAEAGAVAQKRMLDDEDVASLTKPLAR